MPPHTPPRRKHLTRDERIAAKALRFHGGFTYKAIAQKMRKTPQQIQDACILPATPRKNEKREGAIGPELREQLRAWMEEDPRRREIPWDDLRFYVPEPLSSYGPTALKTALRTLGFRRRIRPRKVELLPAQREARLAFAEEQLRLHPRPED